VAPAAAAWVACLEGSPLVQGSIPRRCPSAWTFCSCQQRGRHQANRRCQLVVILKSKKIYNISKDSFLE
jgi:hypothetical protein